MSKQVDPYSAPVDGQDSGGKHLSLPWFVGAGTVCILLALLVPAVKHAHSDSRRMLCKNNLKQIGLALHNYHDAYDCFPPAFIADDQGQPAHSWRVLILPFMEEQNLYDQYRFDEPWDGPNNSKLVDSMPQLFACPTFSDSKLGTADRANRLTMYMAISDTGAAFDGANCRSIRDVSDGASNTTMVTEARRFANVWMAPSDVSISQFKTELRESRGSKIGHHKDGLHLLMCDGSARFVSHSTDQKSVNALTTIAGGENVSDEFQ